ncbi:hypothetical protein D3C83_249820 [compost metagenome]
MHLRVFCWKSECLEPLDQLPRRRLRVAVQHAGVVQIEQVVLDAGEPRALTALDDDHVA